MSKTKKQFYVEMTDTFGGEANYSWVKRYRVSANTLRGAVSKVSRDSGFYFRRQYSLGYVARYDATGACVCLFVSPLEGEGERYTLKDI